MPISATERKSTVDALADISVPYDSSFEIQYSNPFKIGAFKGGGQKAVVYAGMLKYFEEHGVVLSDMQEFVGTSAGGLTVGLLGLGYGSEDIKQLFAEEFNNMLGVHNNFDAVKMAVKGLPDLLSNEHFGLITSDKVIPLLDKKVEAKLGKPNATFRDLADYIKANPDCGLRPFSVLGAEMSSGEVKVFSIETSLDMEIASALYITMACQPIFAPLEYKGLKYGDGGISANNPISVTEKIALDKGFPIESILNARMDDTLTKKQLLGYKTDEDYQNNKPDNFIQYVLGLMNNQSNQDNQHGVVPEHRTIIMDNQGIGTFEVDFTEKMVSVLYDEGYKCAEAWYQNYIEDTVAKIKPHPTTFSKIDSMTKQEAKERASILSDALIKLDKYDINASTMQTFLSKTKVLEEKIENNTIYLFPVEDTFQWIGKDAAGNPIHGQLNQLPCDAETIEYMEQALQAKSVEEEPVSLQADIRETLLNGIIESIENRKRDLAKEISIIQFRRGNLSLKVGAAIRYVDQARQELSDEIAKAFNPENGFLFNNFETDLSKFEEEFSDIKPFTSNEPIENTLEESKDKLIRLMGILENITNTSESLTQTGEFMRYLLQEKIELLKDLENIFTSLEDCQKKGYQEGVEYFQKEAFQKIEQKSSVTNALNESWFEDLKNQLHANQFDQLNRLIKEQIENTSTMQSEIDERINQIKDHRRSSTTLFYDAQKLLNRCEAFPEAQSLKQDIDILRQNLSHYIQTHRSFFNTIINFFCKLLNVKEAHLPTDIYFLRQAKALKNEVDEIRNSINEDNTKSGIIDKRIAFEEKLEEKRSPNTYGFFSNATRHLDQYQQALNTDYVISAEDDQEEAMMVSCQ